MKNNHAPLTQTTNSHYVVYNVKSIGRSKRKGHKPCDLLWAARHNLRFIDAELGAGSSIDPERKNLNVILAGPSTPEGVQQIAKKRISDAVGDARKLRYDHVQAVEIMISLTGDLEDKNVTFFEACVRWINSWFGVEAILSATVHLDENKPHLHVLISPVVNGQVKGSRLISRENLMKQRAAFEKVAAKFGVRLPPAKLSKNNQRLATQKVLEHIALCQSSLTTDQAWPSIQYAIAKDPLSFAADYGINLELEIANQRMRTCSQIFTSKGKGPQREN